MAVMVGTLFLQLGCFGLDYIVLCIKYCIINISEFFVFDSSFLCTILF